MMREGVYLVLSLVLSTAYSATAIETIADKFVWAENLVCDPNNNMLWVSDNSMGTISTISDSKISDDYRTVVHLGGPTGQSFESITGLALNKDSTILYAAAEIKNATTDDKEYFIIAVNMEQKQSYEVVTQIPEVGNGVAIDYTTGLLYVTNTLKGKIYEVTIESGNVREYGSLTAANGAWIDQEARLLYISQFLNGNVVVYDLTWTAATVPLRIFKPEGLAMLDDFTLTADGKAIIGADFKSGNVVRFSLEEGTAPVVQILASDLTSPTSARFGCGGPLNGYPSKHAVFVTEGGGLTRLADDRRVLQIDL